jgi:hypothetical protein
MQHNNKHRRYNKEEQYNTYDKITQYIYSPESAGSFFSTKKESLVFQCFACVGKVVSVVTATVADNDAASSFGTGHRFN